MYENLTPALLVSMPNLDDPYFEKSVILLCDYTAENAFGVVINRPSTIHIKDIMVGEVGLPETTDHPILMGGPVQPEFLWALHSAEFNGETTMKVGLNVHLSSVQEIILRLANGEGPKTYHMGFGCAGWGPGQLDQEIREGAWWLAPMNADLVLRKPYSQRWVAVLKSLGLDPNTTGFSDIGEA